MTGKQILWTLPALLLLAAPAGGRQTQEQPAPAAPARRGPAPEVVDRPVVYSLPGMDKVQVRKDISYKATEDPYRKMDVYLPPGLKPGERRPAVVFIHGGTSAEFKPKDWGLNQSWGRLAGASGLVGVTFTYGMDRLRDGSRDVADALAYVRSHAGELGIDADRLCLMTFSGGGLMLSPYIQDPQPSIRCIVALYAATDVRDSRRYQAIETPETLQELSTILQLPKQPGRVPPIFFVRAGKDSPGLLESIDRFVTEALARNIPLTLVNHPEGPHGFDNQLNDERSRRIVREILEFFQDHLGTPKG